MKLTTTKITSAIFFVLTVLNLPVKAQCPDQPQMVMIAEDTNAVFYPPYQGNTNTIPSSIPCNTSMAFCIYPQSWSTSSASIYQPCLRTRYNMYYTNVRNNVTESRYENGNLIYTLAPGNAPIDRIGGSTPPASGASLWDFSLYQINPAYTHSVSICKTGGGVITSDSISVRDCWRNTGSMTYAANAAFTTGCGIAYNDPANSGHLGSTAWSISPAAAWPAIYDFGNGMLYVDPIYLAPATYTVTYTFTPPGGTPACASTTANYIFTITNPYTATWTAPTTLCSNGACTALTTSGTAGGVWSGTGVSGTNFCPSISGAGTFAVTYDVGPTTQCGALETHNITVSAAPTFTAANTYSMCTGGSVGISVTGPPGATYTWSPAGSLNNANSATPTASPGSTTVYTVTGTSSAGCVTSTPKTVTVTVNTPPTITVGSPSYTMCPGGSVGLSVSGASTYTWSPSGSLNNANSATPTASPGSNTVYTVTGTSAAGCTSVTSATTSVTLAAPVTLALSPSANYTMCPGGSVGMSVSGASTYTWSPAGSLNNANSPTPTASPGSTTIYSVSGTDASGCLAAAGTTATVTVNTPVTLTLLPSAAYTMCPGGSVVMNVSGASTYTWSPAGSLNNANSASPTASPGTNTVYSVSATDASGCAANAGTTATVTINTPPVLSINPPSGYTVCAGGTVGMSVSGAITYTWSPAGSLNNANSSTPNSTPGSTTVYTVNGTDAAGCVSTTGTTATVTVNTPVTLTVNASPSSLCTGQTTTITATGASTYTWSANAGSVTTNTVSITPAGTDTYTVNGTDASGCSTLTGTVAVAIGAGLTVTITPSQATLCTGQTETLTATGATNYTWMPGGLTTSSITINPTSNTSYTLTGNSGGCAGSTALTVTVTATPTITATTAGSGSICAGASTTLTAGGASTYTWSPAGSLNNANSTTPVATPGTTTIYTLTGTDVNGCTAASPATTTVTVNTPATLTLTPSPASLCTGGTTTITASGASTYTWSANAGSATTNTVSITPAGTDTYIVNATDINGCSSPTQTISITVGAALSVTITPSQATLCSGQTETLTASGAANYTWSPGGFTTPTLTVSPGSNTTYTLDGSNGSCAGSTTLIVTVTATPTITATTAGSGAICSGASTTLTASGASNYTWMPGSINSATATVSPAATTDYTLTGESGGCSVTSVTTVTVTASPTVAIIASSGTICAGANTTLSAATAASYTWMPGGSNASSITVNPANTTTYTVSGANGTCSATATSIIVVNPSPGITAVPNIDSARCGMASGVIHAVVVSGGTPGTPAYTYQWYNGSTLIPGATLDSLTGASMGTYSVLVMDANGCTVSAAQATFSVPGTGAVIASIAPSLIQGQSPVSVTFTNTSIGATVYNWNFGNGFSSAQNPSQTFTAPGTYTVVMTASAIGNCSDSDTAYVIVDDATTLIIPNIFSPNGDGLNDVFFIMSTGMKTLHCDIFNRWGTKMFTLLAPNQVWDGKTPNGESATDGTYFYILTCQGYDGKTYNKQGPLTLVR